MGQEMTEIQILDACCGGKMFWFDKHEPHTTYLDNRSGTFIFLIVAKQDQ